MKIEAGKTYKLRNGQLAKINTTYPDAGTFFAIFGLIQDCESSAAGWSINGKYIPNKDSEFDIVAEYDDDFEFWWKNTWTSVDSIAINAAFREVAEKAWNAARDGMRPIE